MSKKIRTRFAPSPTGPLHIGGIRTALYNYLFAKQNGGEFIMRIEDTDQKRLDTKAEQYIHDAFEWVGLSFDESPSNPNPKYGNYRQSEREYKQYIDHLLKNGFAYYAFDTEEELAEIRDMYKKMKKTFSYNYITRNSMKNSIILSSEEVAKRLENGDPYVVRFKMPRDRNMVVDDLIRGKVKFNTNTLDDKVLMKKDGTPTYHMANIVDDHLMEISHVIRGEEWLPSLPLHILLYEAMEWEPPKFAHLNLILNPDGDGKLSKRSAVKRGFSVFPLTAEAVVDGVSHTMEGYLEMGYEPMSVLNYLALLGWAPKGNKEIVSFEEMIEEFDFSRLSKAGARFNLEKLEWYNSQYVNMLSVEDLNLPESDYSDDRLEIIAEAVKERAKFRHELGNAIDIFYGTVTSYTDIEKVNENAIPVFNSFLDRIDDVNFNDSGEIKQFIYNLTEEHGVKFGKAMPGLRQAITGGLSGPDLFSTMYVIGKDETQKRIAAVLHTVNHG
jgi:nondiscriminating glutamyl-tRNA synthetase